MKWPALLFCLMSVMLLSQPALALDSTQKTAMNKALTGSSGKLTVDDSNTGSSGTAYTDAVTGVRIGITLVIAGFYFLFVAWLAKSQYVAWAEGDIDAKEGFGSLVIATLMLLLIVFILTT